MDLARDLEICTELELEELEPAPLGVSSPSSSIYVEQSCCRSRGGTAVTTDDGNQKQLFVIFHIIAKLKQGMQAAAPAPVLCLPLHLKEPPRMEGKLSPTTV